jgi:hypothetical protein
MINKFLQLIDGKKVFLATHWDADGVASGAIIYHLIKDRAKSVSTLSKGEVFIIEPADIPKDAEIVICTDIHCSADISQPVIYIDHHPDGDDEIPSPGQKKESYLMKIHDKNARSCTLVIWEKLIKKTDNPYFVFLTLMGFFGDGGTAIEIPAELELKALEMFPELMEQKQSRYREGNYLEIQKYVSALNTGKRMHWSGQVPFELLKSIDSHEPFIYYQHPLAVELQRYKDHLREYYSMSVKKKKLDNIEYATIVCDKNIQGVLCQKHMDGKPMLVMNTRNGKVIGSMRVPDDLDFDAGVFLEQFNGQIPSYIGGGHEKAGGLTVDKEHYDEFIELISKK